MKIFSIHGKGNDLVWAIVGEIEIDLIRGLARPEDNNLTH